MREGLLEEIRTLGHWRVNYRPIDEGRPQQLTALRELIRNSTVSIRGWDFPHHSHRNDDHGGDGIYGDYYQNWTDWSGFKEFWRIYKSRQFLYFSALHEDTKEWSEGWAVGNALNAIAAAYSIFEFVEFAHRMAKAGPYNNGATLDLRLINTRDRRLVAGRGRMPFFEKQFRGDEIKLNYRWSQSDLLDDHLQRSLDVCLDFFDHFDWAPSKEQLENEQRRFYARQFS